MSHYDVDYSNMTPQAKHLKAIDDIKDYMGEEKYKSLSKAFKTEGPLTMDEFEMYCSLAGIQGYPCLAWYNEVFPFG